VRVAALVAVVAGVTVAVAAGAFGDTAKANRASARVEASRLLGLVQLPVGTVRSASDSTGAQHGLGQPTYDEVTPNLVDAHAWWTSSASSSAVLAYVAAHLPAGAKRYTTGSSSGPPGTLTTASQTFSLPPVAGVLTERVLGVTVVPLADGATAVRTDGEAVWLTPRPQWERIPAGVRSVVFTASGTGNDGRLGPLSTPRTLTGVAAGRLVAFINRAQIVQPGAFSCPVALAESVNLQFMSADGATVARAVENSTGCASVTLTVGRRTGPALSDYPSLTDELVRLGAVPVCPAGQLTASASLPERDGPVTARVISFDFENRSDVVCHLSGFPRLAFFSSAGRRLPITITDQDASTVRRAGLEATSVLDPNQSADFGASYAECSGARVAVRAQVALPGVARRFRLTVGTRRKPVTPCHGAVGVGNLNTAFG
jgi:Protein of unknown function (DUF4232)